MFDCWNANAYYLSFLTIALLLAVGFGWGSRPAQSKYSSWINRQLREQEPRRSDRRRPCLHDSKLSTMGALSTAQEVLS